MSFVMSLDVEILTNLIAKAFEKETEDRLWEKWLAELPHMDKETFISFENYKQKHFQKQESEKEDEEILQDAENILKMMNKPK